MNLDHLTDKDIAFIGKEALRVRLQTSRSAKVGGASTLTTREWIEILEQYQSLCVFCGTGFNAMGHLKPVDVGGGTTKENCIPVCRSCNSRQGTRLAYKDDAGTFVIDKATLHHPKSVRVQLSIVKEPMAPALRPEEVAEMLDKTMPTICRWCKEKKLPAFKVGRHWRIRSDLLDAYLLEMEDEELLAV